MPVIYLTQFSPFNFRNQNPEWHHMFGGVEGANVAMAMARRESLPANMQRPKSPLGKTYSMPLGGVSTYNEVCYLLCSRVWKSVLLKLPLPNDVKQDMTV